VDRYYKHSGNFRPWELSWAACGTVVSFPWRSLTTTDLQHSRGKAPVLCTIAYGALVGAASGVAMCWGKVRSKRLPG